MVPHAGVERPPDDVIEVAAVGGTTVVADAWDGAGCGVLLVHGLASNARLWDGVAGILASQGHAVCAVDLRGHGRSAKPPAGYDMATVADDLMAVIGILRERGPVPWRRPVAVGQSWGGNVVVELAYRHPGAVAGVVAVDGGVIELSERFAGPADARRELAPPALAGTPAAELERAVRARHPSWSEAAIAGAMANFERLPDGTVAPWLTLDRHLQVLDGLFEHRPSTRFPQLTVPVLFLMADDGSGSSWAADKRAAVDRAVASAGAGAGAVWFERADHDVHAERPEPVARAVADAVATWCSSDPTGWRTASTGG